MSDPRSGPASSHAPVQDSAGESGISVVGRATRMDIARRVDHTQAGRERSRQMATHAAARTERSTAWAGWVGVARLLMIIVRAVDFFEGLLALVPSEDFAR